MAEASTTGSLHCKVISPERVLFEGEAAMVTAPGSEGVFGVLPGHAPLLSALKPGIIVVEGPDKQETRIAVADGIAEVQPDRCIILTETAHPLSGVTSDAAQAKLAEAQAAFESASEEDKAVAEKRLRLAEIAAGALR